MKLKNQYDVREYVINRHPLPKWYKVKVIRNCGVHKVGDIIIVHPYQSMDAFDTNGDYIIFYSFNELDRLVSLETLSIKWLIFCNSIKKWYRNVNR